MSIQIIPKEAAKLPLWQNILFYFSIGLVASILVGYGVLYYFTKQAIEDAKNIETAIQQGKTQQMVSLEDQMKTYRDKIDDFSSLLSDHKLSSNFFGNFEQKIGILEKDTHPEVLFSEMNFDVKGSKVIMSGQAEDFQVVGQQIVLFENEKMVNNVKLSKADINKEGKVDFTLDILLKPELLKSVCGNGIKENEEQCDGQDGIREDFICTIKCTLESSK